MVGSYAHRHTRTRRPVPATEMADSHKSERSAESGSEPQRRVMQSSDTKRRESGRLGIANNRTANKTDLRDDSKSEVDESSICDDSNRGQSASKKELCTLDPMWRFYPKQVQNILK